MSTNNTRHSEITVSQFTRQVRIEDAHGNAYIQTITDRNAARTEARRLAAERNNLRGEYVRTMSQFVVLAPSEQADTGFYGRVYGYTGTLGVTNDDGWCWLTFPEWKEVIRSTQRDFAADDQRLAVEEFRAKAVASARR
jgi:hypothetical protein